MSLKLFISAAEDSAHLYAENLLDHLLKQEPELQSFGLGSEAMEKKGFKSLFDVKKFSIVGVTDIFKNYFFLKKSFNVLIKEIKLQKPSVVLLIDYPGFNLRLAKACKKIGVPVVYFILPKIWASRPQRIKVLKKNCDKVLSIFEFEKEIYKDFGQKFKYIGNPLINNIPKDYLDKSKNILIRQKYTFLEQDKIIALMPGSRKSEIEHILPAQIKIAEALYKANPKLVFSIFLAPSVEKKDIINYLQNNTVPFSIIKANPSISLRIPDIILCALGTATLYAALFLKPCFVMYKTNKITGLAAKLLLNKNLKLLSLPNLLLNKEIYPEFIQEKMKIKDIVFSVQKFLDSEDLQKQMQTDLTNLTKSLHQKTPIKELADVLLAYK